MANYTFMMSPAGGVLLTYWASYIISALLAYMIACSRFRYQRQHAMHEKFKFSNRQSLSLMTNDDAQSILTYLAELEFPKLMETSLQFALFKASTVASLPRVIADSRIDLWHTHDFQSPRGNSGVQHTGECQQTIC